MAKYLRWMAGLLALVSVAGFAQEKYVLGQQYEEVTPAQSTSTGDKIEVVEMFWYGCPHCYSFEPLLSQWDAKKADDVELVRIPAVFSANWEIHARAYYALETMGKLQALHKPLFDAIHRDRKPLVNENAIAQFVASQGASADAFRQAYNSPAVDSKVERAKKLSRAYGISGVPSVIIAGKYRSSGSAAGSYGELLKVIDFLVDKERAGNRHVTAAP